MFTGPKTYRLAKTPVIFGDAMQTAFGPLMYRDQAEGYAAQMRFETGRDFVAINCKAESRYA